MRSTKFFVGLTMCFLMAFSVFVSCDIFLVKRYVNRKRSLLLKYH